MASQVTKGAKAQEKTLMKEFKNVLIGDSNTTDVDWNGSKGALDSKTNCTGGLLDFIQCIVNEKIESFKQELGKLLIPTIPPYGHELQTIDSKIEGSLEQWIRKFSKHSDTEEHCESEDSDE